MSDSDPTPGTDSDDELAEIRARKRERLEASVSSHNEPIRVDGTAELSAAIDEHELLLVDFYADWCGPCQMMEPTLEALAAESDLTVAKVDVDANQDLAGQYNVRGIPLLLLFVDGQQVERLTGVQQRESLERLVNRYS
jgi:thioredoxin 1